VVSRLPRSAPAWLDRLSGWLEPFEVCFSHVAQRGAFRRYLLGLLSDSRRKSMSAMLERVRDPGTYQAFQHFITDAPWSADAVWRHLRATIPDRTGVLILDGTSFPKQGPHSVGVARQYCGALGKIANCQTAVTVALWTGARAWMLGAALYLPESWLTPEQRTRARIPAAMRGLPKWQLALTLLRQVRASGITVTAVLGDAEFGESATLRRTLHRARLPYALGVSSTLKAFVGTPAVVAPVSRGRLGRPRSRPTLAPEVSALEARLGRDAARARVARGVVAERHPACLARPILRDARYAGPRLARSSARTGGLAPLRTGPRGERPDQYYLVNLPATASLRTLVRLTHQRWAIEQQYQELKDELGFDHFEGRSLPGWQRHVVLTALAYTWLQCERQRRGTHHPTLPVVRRHHRDPDRPLLRDASTLSAHHAETGRHRSPDLTKSY
jgi:SRSO17 transposase